MERFTLFLQDGLKKKLEREMKKHGFTKIAPFIRYILLKFLKNE